MKISIVTLFPKMIKGFFEESIVKRAVGKKLIEIEFINLRDFAINKYGSVDDRPYGGGAGMVMRVDVMYRALSKIFNFQFSIFNKNVKSKIILTSAKGKQFNQKKAKEYSRLDHLIIIAGHYEGVDERVLEYVDEEISLGDFIMTGGEITAAVIVDSIVRLIPGTLNKKEATQLESFFEIPINQLIETVGKTKILLDLQKKGMKKVRLLEYPHYTRPENFKGKKVPNELLSGNHRKIEEWRIKEAYKQTFKKRKDLLH